MPFCLCSEAIRILFLMDKTPLSDVSKKTYNSIIFWISSKRVDPNEVFKGARGQGFE